MSNVTFSIDNDHGYPRFRKVGNAFIANDRNKFSPRIPLCQCADMLKGSFTSGQPVLVNFISHIYIEDDLVP